MLSFFPCKPGQKGATETFWNYRKYTVSDIGKKDNIAMLAGTQVFKNAFSLVFDFDFDVRLYPKVFEMAKEVISDTVIVKSGGRHNGFHAHYLCNVPIRSVKMPKQNGILEIKAIGEDGRPEPMMLPPSAVNTQYRVIWPYSGDYIDFVKVKQIDPHILKQKLTRLNQLL